MSTDLDIDELLKQDEAELREKKKRLKGFASTLTEWRTVSDRAAQTAAELVERGDLSKADVARVFNLSKGERATLFPPAARKPSASAAEQSPERENAPSHAPSESY